MNDRDTEILRTLANSVRAMSLDQVARAWWSDTRWGRSRAKKTLVELVDHDLVHVQRVLSRPSEQLSQPLTIWRPGDIEPAFDDLAHLLHRRARRCAKMVPVVFAARRTVDIFGSGAVPTIKLTQMTHDLQVTEVFLHYWRRGNVKSWVSEDNLPPDWPIRQRPDALLRDAKGVIVHAVEYGGDYPVERLVKLHEGLSRAELSYEIW